MQMNCCPRICVGGWTKFIALYLSASWHGNWYNLHSVDSGYTHWPVTVLVCSMTSYLSYITLHCPCGTVVKPILTTLTPCKDVLIKKVSLNEPSWSVFTATTLRFIVIVLKFAIWYCPKVTRVCIVKGNCCSGYLWHNPFPRMATLYCTTLRGWMNGTMLSLYSTATHKLPHTYHVHHTSLCYITWTNW